MSGPRVVTVRQLGQVGDALAEGAVVVVPGDGGYQLAVPPVDPYALLKAYDANAPSHETFVQFVVGERRQAVALSAPWSKETAHLTDRMWPGPLTVIVPVPVSGSILSHRRDSVVHLTMPAWRPLRTLCRQSGPLAVTMLQHADGSPLVSAEEVREQLAAADGGVPFILDGGLRRGPPTTVVDCTVSPPQVRRIGALPESYVEAALLMSARKRKWFTRRS
jgi:L-threonylcarbamoyladenylate synthase